MPRHIRVEFSGAIYHVTIRGNAGQEIFGDDRDRERFLLRLGQSIETYGIRLYLFCLMSNHVHLLVETPSANLRRFMQSLETGYTVYYNLRHGRSGHLFAGRYKAKLVEGDEYLLKLSRYVHLNPIQVKGLKNRTVREKIAYLRQYRWSSYRGYVGLGSPLKFVTYGPVLEQAGGGGRRQRKEYRRYVESGIGRLDGEFTQILKESPVAIGGDEFRAWVRDRCLELGAKAASLQDVAFRRTVPEIEPEKVLEIVSRHLDVKTEALRERRRNSTLRAIAARMLVKYGQMNHRQVAGALGMGSGVSASLQARKAASLWESDRKSRKLIAAIEESLDAEAAQRA